MSHPEHTLQAFYVKWVAVAVESDHELLATDRSAATSKLSHQREKARGIRKGQADTCLYECGKMPAWIEFKAPGKVPSEKDPTFMAQMLFGRTMKRLGHDWSWQNSIVGACAWLRSIGVKLRPGAEAAALIYDGKVAAAIAKAAAKKPARTTKPAPRYTVGKRVASRAARAGIRL